MVNISVETDIQEVQIKFDTLFKTLSDGRSFFDGLGTKLLTFYGPYNFAKQGAATNSSPWKALSDFTLRARAAGAGYYAKPSVRKNSILIWTGALLKGFRKDPRNSYLRIYNDAPHFGFHQKGGKGLPKRKMLVVNEEMSRIVEKEYADFIIKAIK